MLIIYQSDAEGGAHAARRRRRGGGGGDCGSEKLDKRPATTTLLIATHFVDHAPTSILT